MRRLMGRKSKSKRNSTKKLKDSTASNQTYHQTGRNSNASRHQSNTTHLVTPRYGLTPVVSPRVREAETKEEVSDNMTENEQKATQDANENETQPTDTPDASNVDRPRGWEFFQDSEMSGRYEFIRYVGHGSYGHVCEATDLQTTKKVAIKKIPKVFDNEIDAKRLLRELRILRALKNHEAIVDLVDILPPRDPHQFNSIILVFEFVDTDLAKIVQSDQHFTTLHIQYMLYQILLGVKFMHSANIAHRDLKPANLLVNEDCTVKVCDFGLSRGFMENVEAPHPVSENMLELPAGAQDAQRATKSKKPKREITRHVVTRWYRAPEVILLQQQRNLLAAIDMWSIGCILAELLGMMRENCRDASQRRALFPGTSSFPLSADDPFQWAERTDQLNVIFDVIGTPTREEIANLLDQKARKYLSSLPKKFPVNFKRLFPGCSDSCLELLRGMLQFDIEKRFTVDDALSHPYLSRVRDEEAELRHNPTEFEFEDVAVSLHQLRALIVDEISQYNPTFMQDLRRHASRHGSNLIDAGDEIDVNPSEPIINEELETDNNNTQVRTNDV